MHRLIKSIAMASVITAIMVLSIVVVNAGVLVSIDQTFNIQTIDVDSDPGRKFTCTHAAMANVISAATGATQEQAVELYRDFVDNLGDRPVSAPELWEYLMDSVGSTGKARYQNFYSYAGVDKGRLLERIMGSILEAKMVTISIYKNSRDLGHALTVYGVRVEDDGSFTLVYVDNEDESYMKHFGRIWSAMGKTYMKYRDGDTVLIRGYSTVRVIEDVIRRGVRE
jgi:hypothetical protein